jgi:hypothetical protein
MTVMGLYMLGFLPGWGGYSVALGGGVFLFSIGGGAVSLMLVKGRG